MWTMKYGSTAGMTDIFRHKSQGSNFCPLSYRKTNLPEWDAITITTILTNWTCKSKASLLRQSYLSDFNTKISKLLKYKQNPPLWKQWWSTGWNISKFSASYNLFWPQTSRRKQQRIKFGCIILCIWSEHTQLSSRLLVTT